MIELINTRPAPEVLQCIKMSKQNKSKITVAEIGIGYGGTTLGILKTLCKDDCLYLFDLEEKLTELTSDIVRDKLDNGVTIVPLGNTRKAGDSYAWTMGKLALELNSLNGNPRLFDVVYLDGAHTFLHDAATCCLLKQMLNYGGLIVFDDMYWSLEESPTQNPRVNPGVKTKYTDDQIVTPHVNMIVDLFVRNDPSFEQVFLGENKTPWRAVFSKKLPPDVDTTTPLCQI